MSWLSRAQANTRSVQPILYVPLDYIGTYSDYQVGISLAMSDIQFWFKRVVDKSFRKRPLKTIRGTKTQAWFETQGMKEASHEVITSAGFDSGDPLRVFVSFVIAPKGYVGGAIGRDAYVPNDGDVAYPSPGRTGLQGRGLEVMCGLPAAPTTEWWSVTAEQWRGAICHELVHCLAFSLPHTSDDPATENWEPAESILFSWWSYPNVGLLDSEKPVVQASPFLR